PAGILLCIFNLPKSYNSSTVLRFPAVVGAQTNVMRDIAITQGESITSIFNSFQVLEGAIKKLGLRMRIRTPHVFMKDTFKSINYGESLGLGVYRITPQGDNAVTVHYKPRRSNGEYLLYTGSPSKDGRI